MADEPEAPPQQEAKPPVPQTVQASAQTTHFTQQVNWQRATDRRQVATLDEENFNRQFDDDLWRGIAARSDAATGRSFLDAEFKLEALLWKQLAQLEGIAVKKGLTESGQLFREYNDYVLSLAGVVPKEMAMLGFLSIWKERVGLGHTEDAKTAKVQPQLRELISSLSFVDPARKAAAKLPEDEVTFADFAFAIRARCVDQDRDAFVVIDSGTGAEAVGEGRSWTEIVLGVLIDPAFDIRRDIVYGYDIGRYTRITQEIVAGRVPPGSARFVDELDSMFYGRTHSTKRQIAAMRNLHRSRKYNVAQGGAGNDIFGLDYYPRHTRCTHRVETRSRGVVRIAVAGIGECDDNARTFGHPWHSENLSVPGPDDCGLRDVYQGLYKACCRLTDRECLDDDELDDLYRKRKPVPSPLDEALDEDPDWGLELLEGGKAPAQRVMEGLLTALQDKGVVEIPLTSSSVAEVSPRRG